MNLRRAVLLLALAALAGSCAYYNTFYLARKYYFKGTGGLPYAVEKVEPSRGQYFPKAIDLSKKVLANYPKSKWVPHAYLLWARALLGRDDPRESLVCGDQTPHGLHRIRATGLGTHGSEYHGWRPAVKTRDKSRPGL